MHSQLFLEIGLLFLGFGKCARSMENWFFPSSDVTRVLKNGAI